MRTILPLLCCLGCSPGGEGSEIDLDAGDFDHRPWSDERPVFTLRPASSFPWAEIWLRPPTGVAGEGLVTIEELHVPCDHGSSTELGDYQLVFDPTGTGWFELDGEGLHLAMVGTGADALDSEELLVRFYCTSGQGVWGEVGAVTFDDGTTFEDSTLVDEQDDLATPSDSGTIEE